MQETPATGVNVQSVVKGGGFRRDALDVEAFGFDGPEQLRDCPAPTVELRDPARLLEAFDPVAAQQPPVPPVSPGAGGGVDFARLDKEEGLARPLLALVGPPAPPTPGPTPAARRARRPARWALPCTAGTSSRQYLGTFLRRRWRIVPPSLTDWLTAEAPSSTTQADRDAARAGSV